MARTNSTDVKAIIDTSLLAAEVDPFITDASLFVDNTLASSGLDAATLEMIEKYLAAHFLSMLDQRIQTEAFPSGIRFNYQGKTDMGLDQTFYGQMAKVLDTSGKLTLVGLKPAQMTVFKTKWDESSDDRP